MFDVAFVKMRSIWFDNCQDAIDLSAKTGHYGSWTPVQTAGTPPAARTMHSAVTDGFGGMWIFGGLRVGPSTSPSDPDQMNV